MLKTFEPTQVNKVVVWGHKLLDARTANTFAFIHDSWYRTFKYLGYDVLWLDNQDDVSNLSLDNSIFLTEGQVDQNIPILDSCKYVIHNCNIEKYKPIISNVLNLQVYTHDCLSRKIEPLDQQQLCFYQPEADFSRPDHCCDNRTIYQPWATNLLPNEIDPENTIASRFQRQKRIFWIGSIMGGPHRNDDKISELASAAKADGVQFIHAKLQNDLQPRAIAESWIAPAVQGAWQVEKGYVPCRVFKNLSFGRMTPTNSETVNTLFHGKLPYSSDVKEMYSLGTAWEENPDKNTLSELVSLVKEKHTFVNRVRNILKVL
jgi:hypothetical protein